MKRSEAEERISFDRAKIGQFALLWHVPITGFDWDMSVRPHPKHNDLSRRDRRDGLDRGPCICWQPADTASYRLYPPLEKTKNIGPAPLHRRFAHLKPERDSILKFAYRHGLLTKGMLLSDGRWGEPLALWHREITAMTELLAVWDMVKSGRSGRLGQHVIWRKTPKAVIWQRRSARNSSALLSSCVIAPHDAGEADLLESVWKFGDAIEPARYLVYCRINDRLAGHVNPMIMAYRGGELLLFPDSLLTALYVLFALEVSGRARYPEIQCAGCGTTFTPSHGSQRYCVPACRKWHWDQTARKDALSQIN